MCYGHFPTKYHFFRHPVVIPTYSNLSAVAHEITSVEVPKGGKFAEGSYMYKCIKCIYIRSPPKEPHLA